MSTENDAGEVVIIDDIIESKDADGRDNTDWKALAEKYQGIAKRFKTKADKVKDNSANPVEKKEPAKSDELDYSHKAFLVANGIKGSDEIALARKVMKETGKSLDDVIESKFFQAEIKELRDTKTAKNAIPDPSKRAGQSARDSVEYWLGKGELPPREQRELRTQVVNARIKQEKNIDIFTKNPIAGNYNRNR